MAVSVEIRDRDLRRGLTAGRFITLEGGEGAGKTTQSALLADALKHEAYRCCEPANPAAHPAPRCCAACCWAAPIDWSPQAETLLHFAARAEHVAKTIQPALEAGTWVVCDRFFDSTLAYQGYGQGADRGFIAAQIRLLGITPDLTMVLDVPEAVAAARMRQRGGDADRYERLDAAFHSPRAARLPRHRRRRTPALHVAGCLGDIQAVHTAIMTAVGL